MNFEILNFKISIMDQAKFLLIYSMIQMTQLSQVLTKVDQVHNFATSTYMNVSDGIMSREHESSW